MHAPGRRLIVWPILFAAAMACGRSQRPGNAANAAQGSADPATLLAPEPGRLYHGVLPRGTTEPDSDASPATPAQWVRERGAVPFIRLMMRSQPQPLVTDPRFTLDRIVAGELDGDLAAWADAARAFGSPLVVEYGTEVNGDWNPWSAPYNGGLDVGPDKFKRAYRHIVALMRARGALNITWALHYNGENYPG